MSNPELSRLFDDLVADFEKFAATLRTASRKRVFEPEVLETLYGVAYGALSGRHYDRAAPLFAFLAAQRPDEARFLAGLGICRAAQDEHLQAVLALGLAAHFEPTNPHHLLSLARSLLAMGETDMARHALKALELSTEGKPEHQPILNHARGLMRVIKNAGTATAPAAAG